MKREIDAEDSLDVLCESLITTVLSCIRYVDENSFSAIIINYFEFCERFSLRRSLLALSPIIFPSTKNILLLTACL